MLIAVEMRGGGKGDQIANFWKNTHQVYLIIIQEWPKNNLFMLKNLDNFSPGAFY